VAFISDELNAFDAAIIALSLVESAASFGTGLVALRSLRLFRVFRLARFSVTLRNQLDLMYKTIDLVLPYLALLAIYLFIFAIMGMNLFGSRFVILVERHIT
jgi:hypothetical protein